MATHSSILPWESLWTEDPGGLLTMELQRVCPTTERLSRHARMSFSVDAKDIHGTLPALSSSVLLTHPAHPRDRVTIVSASTMSPRCPPGPQALPKEGWAFASSQPLQWGGSLGRDCRW